MGDADAAAPSSHTLAHTVPAGGGGEGESEKGTQFREDTPCEDGEGAGLTNKQEQRRPMGENTEEKQQQKKKNNLPLRGGG